MTRTKAERQAIVRDGQTCRRCLRSLWGIPASVHHRLPRSGGTQAQVDRVDNLVVVCGSGTTPGSCHRWIHSHPDQAEPTGWTILRGSYELPSEIPLVNLQGHEFFLSEEGGIHYLTHIPGFLPTDPADYIPPWGQP